MRYIAAAMLVMACCHVAAHDDPFDNLRREGRFNMLGQTMTIQSKIARGNQIKNRAAAATIHHQEAFSALSNSQSFIGQHGVTSHHFTFPGTVTQADYITDSTMIVAANGDIFATRNHGRDWECWTASPNYGGVLEGKVRLYWTQTDSLSTDNLAKYTRMLFGTGIAVATDVRTYYVPTTLGSTSGAAVELVVAPSAALAQFPQLKAGSIVFESFEFHPTRPETHAFGFVTDPTCDRFAVVCRTFAFVTTNMHHFYLIPLFEASVLMWENPVAPAHVNFTAPPVERSRMEFETKTYSAQDFFMLLSSSPQAAGDFVRVPMDDVNWATVTEAVLRPRIVRKEGNALYATAIDGYEYITGVDPNNGQSATLLVSANNFRTVAQAEFPTHMFTGGSVQGTEIGYSVLDSRESIFISVLRASGFRHQAWGQTYVSGVHGRRYTLSLPYTRASFLSNGRARLDFHRVSGLDGILIANVVTNHDDVQCRTCLLQTCQDKCSFATVISRDNGKTWQRIPPPGASSATVSTPSPDVFGVIDERDDVTSLHLHGLTSQMTAHVSGILSSRHAPGLLLAHGNVGVRLSQDPSTSSVFMSRDAGESWTELATGPHLYDEGDLGGLLYMAPPSTNADGYRLNFSVDAGESFQMSAVLAPQPQPIHFVWSSRPRHDPLIREALFIGQDSALRTHALHVDFSGSERSRCTHLHEPDTTDSDFETFTPRSYYSELEGGEQCLLGRHMVYTRRKMGRSCWISPTATVAVVDYSLPVQSVNCQCTIDDFECDFGFTETTGGRCEAIDPKTPQQICDSGAKGERWALHYYKNGKYWSTKGFRKLDGDSCVNGVVNQMLPHTQWVPCMVTAPSVGHKIPTGIVLALLLVICFAVFYKVNPRFRATIATYSASLNVSRITQFLPQLSSQHRYGAVPTDENFQGGPPTPHHGDEDDEEIPRVNPAQVNRAPRAVTSAVEEDPDDTDLESHALHDTDDV